MSEQRVIVNITDLNLYVKNPRFEDIADSQRDAILHIVEDQKDKLTKLAADIAQNGLGTLDNIAITKDTDGKFIVREGNRRIAAIKLLIQPNIIQDYKAMYEKFKQLNKEFSKHPISTVECVLYEDEAKLNRLIELRHTGENGGVGLSTWNTIQKRRFDESLGNKSLAISAVDFIMHCDLIDTNIKENLYKISITNLERLFSDPYVRGELGIYYRQGEPFVVDTENSETFSVFQNVLKDMIFNSEFKVSLIYNKDNRKSYIMNIKSTLEESVSDSETPSKNNKNNNADKSKNSNTGTHHSSNVGEAKNESKQIQPQIGKHDTAGDTKNNQDEDALQQSPKFKQSSVNRKKLIPSNCKLAIAQHRLNKIYDELRKMEIDKYPNAAAVLFRTFIELSFDYYAKCRNISGFDVQKDCALPAKMDTEKLEKTE